METKNTTTENTNNVQSKSVPSKKIESSSDDEDEEVCLICCNPITFYSVGPCNHRQTCSMCSIRLRELYKDKECPFCKKTNDKVVFTENKTLPFEQFKLSELIENSPLGIYTDSEEHNDTIKQLWDARCPVCNIYYVEFTELKKHIKTAHQSQYCELCLQERKIFLHEQKVYNKKQLQTHMREGDEGSQIKGHPKCEFCDRALYSSDHLYEHLERNHFTCHICEKDGHRFQYYKDYNQLEKHFGSAHYLCPERDCLEKKFVVFRTLLDLQAHELNVHGYKFSKQEQTKLRQIQVNFTVSRSEEPRNSNRSRYDRQEFDRHIAAPSTNVFQNNAITTTTTTITSPPVSQPELKKEEEPISKEKQQRLDEELKQELAARNKKLIQTMKDILQDDVKFKEFRSTSGQFLTGAINELQYYKAFVKTFGPKKADELFSELIDLLPDETKREKLLAAQRKTKDEEKEFPQLPAQPPKPAKNKKKTANTSTTANSVWKAPAPAATTTTTTTTTTAKSMKAAIAEGIHCTECGEQVPSKDWDKHLKLHARQKQQIEEQAKQAKIEEAQKKREAEERKREEEQAQRNKLNSSAEFPSLPGGAPPGLNLHPKNATIFNRKAFSEQDFPSLPITQRPPPGIKFEDVQPEQPEQVEEEEPQMVGKKGKKQQKKVVLRWG